MSLRRRPTSLIERREAHATARAALEAPLGAVADSGAPAGHLVNRTMRGSAPFKALPPLPRFLLSCAVTDAGCWEWMGARKPSGYGQFRFRRHNWNAHRVGYVLFRGEIPDELHLDHLCLNKSCVNPEHLEAVTHAENTRRYGETVTHCSQGHEYTPENTIRKPSSGDRRNCRACHNERTTIRHARKQVAVEAERGQRRGSNSAGLLDADIEAMRARRASGERVMDLALEFGVSAKYASAVIAGSRRRKARHTGPSQSTLTLLKARSGGQCEFVHCDAEAVHTHHRRPRGQGSTRRPDANLPGNLLRLCLAHHDWIESHRAEALADGLLLPQTASPAAEPCRTRHGYVYLLDDGTAYELRLAIERAELPEVIGGPA